MAIQIALSLMVMKAFVRSNWLWLITATLVHALVNDRVVFLHGVGWSPVVLEGVVLLFALAGLALIPAPRPKIDWRVADASRENYT